MKDNRKTKINLPCIECNKLYIDNIDPRVDLKKGGYIICATCLMKGADQLNRKNKKIQIDLNELITTIKEKKLKKYRKDHKLTQTELADQLGFSEVQYKRIEKIIPSDHIIQKVVKRLIKKQKKKQQLTN